MKYWFTSDTHFGHKRTLELSRRPFKSVEEMNEVMVENWNSVVEEEDTVFHLGDFGDYNFSNRLKGNIILLFGNYERKDVADGLVKPTHLITKYNFKTVFSTEKIIYEIKGLKLSMVHEPLNMKNREDFYLFGHIHKSQMIKKNGLNVGVDCHNFKPINLETVLFYKNAIENHYDENVFC